VTHNLNDWADLVFGCRQQGEEAIKSSNVFYYLTYESQVDWEAVEEDEKLAIETQITHFGQIPKMLLKKSHPRYFLDSKNAN
jgi:hypothetical protein